MEEENKEDVMSKQSLIKRLSITGQLSRFMVYLAAAVPACIFIFIGLFVLAGFIQPLRISSADGSFMILGTWYDYVVIGLIIATGIFGIYEYMRLRIVRKIDERFPDFVRDLAESRRAGMTFTKAIMYSSKGNYGLLTPEIKKIAMQISWGSSVDNALSAFSKRVNTKLIRRTISLIIEASRSGGNVADVLDAASRDARELKIIESERRASMMSYVAVIYVGAMVFMLIIVVLSKSLIPSMLGEAATGMQEGAFAKSGGITESAVAELFYGAAIVQSMFMGIVAGVFEEGNLISGIKHSFLMLIITFIIFKFIVTGI